MFKSTLIALCLATLTFLGTSYADVPAFSFPQSTELASSVITVKKPQIRSVDVQNGAAEVFMDLDNHGKEVHAVVAAVSPSAKQAQLHNSSLQKGVENMTQITAITIRPAREAELKEGSVHIMLIGLTQNLTLNGKVPVTLIFADGSKMTVQVPVTA